MLKWLLRRIDGLIHRVISVPCKRKHWEPFVTKGGATVTMPGEIHYHVTSTPWRP